MLIKPEHLYSFMPVPSQFAALVLLGTFIPTSAKAFDENGFSSGMTIEAAQRVLAERGEILKPLGNVDTRNAYKGGQSFIITTGLPRANPTGSLSFCNGNLTSYSLNIDGEFPAFERLERDAFRLNRDSRRE